LVASSHAAKGIAETARIQAGEGSDARLLAACLLARSISTASAVVHLIGLGHVVEARILARSLFENKFYLYRLARDDGSAFVSGMFADEAYYHGARGQTMLKEEQSRVAMGKESQSRVQAIVKRARQQNPHAKPLKPQDVISDTDISAASVFYQKLSSDAAHPSITALSRHLVESEGNEVLRFKPRIEDGEVMDTAYLASLALLIVCIAANDALGKTTGGAQLDQLVAEYNDIAARTLPASAPSPGGPYNRES
jgi:hypothetical protein